MGRWRKANTGLQRFPRVASEVHIRVATIDPETDPDTGKLFFRSIDEVSANLSRGGAYLRSWEPLEAGRRVVVTIDLPSGGELQLAGRVAWTRRELRATSPGDLEAPGYGVEFIAGSNRDLSRLDRFLDSVPAKPQAPAAYDPPPSSSRP